MLRNCDEKWSTACNNPLPLYQFYNRNRLVENASGNEMRFVVHPRRIEKGQEFGVISIIQDWGTYDDCTGRSLVSDPMPCFSNCCHNSLDFSGTSCCKPIRYRDWSKKRWLRKRFPPAGQVFPGTENILSTPTPNLHYVPTNIKSPPCGLDWF